MADLHEILWRAPRVGDEQRLLGIRRNTNLVMSEAPANAPGRLELGEPPRPCPELALATVVLELTQQHHKRVVGGLCGEIVDVASRKVRQSPNVMTDMERRLAAQALVQLGDRPGTYRVARVQTVPPCLGLDIERPPRHTLMARAR